MFPLVSICFSRFYAFFKEFYNLNFLPIIRFLITSLLVTASLCLVTTLINSYGWIEKGVSLIDIIRSHGCLVLMITRLNNLEFAYLALLFTFIFWGRPPPLGTVFVIG